MDEFSKNEFENRFIPPKEVIKRVKQLKSLNLEYFTDEDIHKLINRWFHIVPFTESTLKGGFIYRARINQSKDESFDHHDKIYAPLNPPNYGRANKPGERIFYGATNEKVAIFEVIQSLKHSLTPKQPIFLTVGVWSLKEDLKMASIIADPKLHNIRSDIKDGWQKFEDLIENGELKLEAGISGSLILQFFSEEFTKINIRSESDYKFSRLYVNSLKTANTYVADKFTKHKFDGITYPSVALKYKGDNHAIFIESADRKLKFEDALHVICYNADFEKGTIVIGILYNAKSVLNGQITWNTEVYKG
jgi:hypothetical protein